MHFTPFNREHLQFAIVFCQNVIFILRKTQPLAPIVYSGSFSTEESLSSSRWLFFFLLHLLEHECPIKSVLFLSKPHTHTHILAFLNFTFYHLEMMCSEAHSQAFDHKRPPQVTARFKSAACWQNLHNSPVRLCQLLSGGCLGMLELFGEEPECVESGARLAAGISDPSGAAAAAADKKKKNKKQLPLSLDDRIAFSKQTILWWTVFKNGFWWNPTDLMRLQGSSTPDG